MPSVVADVFPGVSITSVSPPLSISTNRFTSCLGAPSALHDMACDQYSRVSNAFERSAEKMCSSLPEMFASSISSARIRIGSCICLPRSPPYCSSLSMVLSITTFSILVNRTLSSSFSIISISAMGLTLFMSYSPASVLGNGLNRDLFHDLGTCSPLITLFIASAIFSRLSESMTLIISIVIPDGPGAFFALNFFASSSISSTSIFFSTSFHIPFSSCCLV